MVYHNIRFRDVGCSNLLETMREQEGVQDLLNYFNVDGMRHIFNKFAGCLLFYGGGGKTVVISLNNIQNSSIRTQAKLQPTHECL